MTFLEIHCDSSSSNAQVIPTWARNFMEAAVVGSSRVEDPVPDRVPKATPRFWSLDLQNHPP